MSTPTNHWKLGLFVVATLLIGVFAVVYFGSRNLPKDTVTYVTYFDEAVTGLEIGAPVKFRGVTVGNVSRIDVAPDRRHVEVSYDIGSQPAQRLALEQASGEKNQIGSLLRAQLGSQGVTGVKYVSLDLFDGEHPVEPLPFKTPRRFIPSTPSTLKNLEAAVTNAADRLPQVTEQLVTLLGRVNTLLDALNQENLPQRAGATLVHMDSLLVAVHGKLDQFDSAKLSREASDTLAQVQGMLARIDGILGRIDGNKGLLANAERTSLSVGDAARNASRLGGEAERTLREVGDAAAAVRELADALERQPDMLLKGRARSTP